MKIAPLVWVLSMGTLLLTGSLVTSCSKPPEPVKKEEATPPPPPAPPEEEKVFSWMTAITPESRQAIGALNHVDAEGNSTIWSAVCTDPSGLFVTGNISESLRKAGEATVYLNTESGTPKEVPAALLQMDSINGYSILKAKEAGPYPAVKLRAGAPEAESRVLLLGFREIGAKYPETKASMQEVQAENYRVPAGAAWASSPFRKAMKGAAVFNPKGEMIGWLGDVDRRVLDVSLLQPLDNAVKSRLAEQLAVFSTESGFAQAVCLTADGVYGTSTQAAGALKPGDSLDLILAPGTASERKAKGTLLGRDSERGMSTLKVDGGGHKPFERATEADWKMDALYHVVSLAAEGKDPAKFRMMTCQGILAGQASAFLPGGNAIPIPIPEGKGLLGSAMVSGAGKLFGFATSSDPAQDSFTCWSVEKAEALAKMPMVDVAPPVVDASFDTLEAAQPVRMTLKLSGGDPTRYASYRVEISVKGGKFVMQRVSETEFSANVPRGTFGAFPVQEEWIEANTTLQGARASFFLVKNGPFTAAGTDYRLSDAEALLTVGQKAVRLRDKKVISGEVDIGRVTALAAAPGDQALFPSQVLRIILGNKHPILGPIQVDWSAGLYDSATPVVEGSGLSPNPEFNYTGTFQLKSRRYPQQTKEQIMAAVLAARKPAPAP